mmetsp:Transcript_18697/g.38443  ORF Transcript_18697/g.38443 Transcript_18697/m.38443 type:complete len:83 (-) Transcript_18697:674-922(-)
MLDQKKAPNRFRRSINKFAIENKVPGGGNGVIALSVAAPIVAIGFVTIFGFFDCVFYSVPLGIALTIYLTEKSLGNQETHER